LVPPTTGTLVANLKWLLETGHGHVRRRAEG
jgi:hypothetical protein